ncbi:hypothetical protein LAZ67_4001205 [Cordylochernes scorpioides]|uniref:Uncharacterized protein n=1 Tax=Cordylochernes scorpioides TaxID=51811 RepID=A0ABY6KGH0_9ARAC|nr:hypothetical protein LAZ67_4001205 [Cordylochernes scorpioides]
MPNTENDWETIANAFEKNSNFPHYIDAIDGKHISHNSTDKFRIANVVSNSLNIPEAKPLGNDYYIPYTVVGYEAFGLYFKNISKKNLRQ